MDGVIYLRLSDFAEKKIINIFDGEILGTAGESDLLIDADNGQIIEIIIPPQRGFSAITNNPRRQISIPWTAVKKIGSEIIVVDIDDNGKYQR